MVSKVGKPSLVSTISQFPTRMKGPPEVCADTERVEQMLCQAGALLGTRQTVGLRAKPVAKGPQEWIVLRRDLRAKQPPESNRQLESGSCLSPSGVCIVVLGLE